MLSNSATHVMVYQWRGDRMLAPGFAVRLLARLRGASLDRRLADGADSSRSRLLAARATQLGRRRTRSRIARRLEFAALAHEGQLRGFAIPPARLATRLNRQGLLDLAAQLRDPGVLYVRGIAVARELLNDGCGPLYTDRRGEALAAAVQRARILLDSPVPSIR